MDVFDLEAFIRLNVDEYMAELGNAEDETKKTGSKLASFLGGTAKAVGAGIAAAGAGVTAIGKQALDVYANYEQLVGGVETLFKDSAPVVEAYADIAYKTAGMSANEYMETVTGFSASLLQSVGGDTVKAAEIADQAIIDMSDNANKMGSDITSIQNAYSGFAKQNYTMLDNLKLGYGGTKKEMERLLADASKLAGVKFNINSYADIINAIHVIQENMDIAGTTAKEASTTIQGSLASMKSSWQNLLVGISDDTQPFDKLMNNFVESVDTVGDNIMPRVETILNGVVKLVDKLAPKIVERLPNLISSILPGVLDAATGLLNAIANEIPNVIKTIVKIVNENSDKIIDVAINIIEVLNDGLLESLPLLIDGFTQLITKVAGKIPTIIKKNVKALPDAIKMIIAALIDNLPVIIEGLVQLMLEIINSLPEIMSYLLNELPTIITMIIGGLMSNLPQLIAGLVEMCIAIAQRIPEIISGIIAALPNVVSAILSGLGPLGEGISSLFDGLTAGVLGPILETAGGLLSDLFSGIALLLTDPKDALEKFFNWFQDKAELTIQSVKDLFTGLFQLIPALIDEKEAADRKEEVDRRMQELVDQGVYEMGADGNYQFTQAYREKMERELDTTVHHEGTITIQGVNNEGEFVGASEYVIDQMRKEQRMGYGY